MPTGDNPSLVDTSVAIPFLVSQHEHHAAVFDALADDELGLAGHAVFETFSVLTRLPPPARLTPATAHRAITANFPHSRHLSPRHAGHLLPTLAQHGLAGGAVYDALVGATAVEHDLTLVSRDGRAAETYRLLHVRVRLLP